MAAAIGRLPCRVDENGMDHKICSRYAAIPDHTSLERERLGRPKERSLPVERPGWPTKFAGWSAAIIKRFFQRTGKIKKGAGLLNRL